MKIKWNLILMLILQPDCSVCWNQSFAFDHTPIIRNQYSISCLYKIFLFLFVRVECSKQALRLEIHSGHKYLFSVVLRFTRSSSIITNLSILHLITLVSNKHDRNSGKISSLHLSYDIPDWPKFFQTLTRCDRVDEYEGMTFGYWQPLHGRKLVWSCGISDLQCADVLVATYHLYIT